MENREIRIKKDTENLMRWREVVVLVGGGGRENRARA